MKKVKVFSVLAVALSIVFVFTAFAADLTVDPGGWTKVGENEVQIGKLDIAEAQATFNGNFAKRVTGVYSDSDYSSGGKFDQERDSAVSYNDTDDGANVIVYTDNLSTGLHDNLGSMTLKWTGGAKLQDGTILDVTMVVDNISIKVNRNSTKPIELLFNGDGEEKTLWMGARYAKEEVSASSLSQTHRITLNDIGVKYDVSFVFTKTGTDEVVNRDVVLNFADLDMEDNTLSNPSYVDGGNAAEYAEGITLLDGIRENKAFVDSDHVLMISDTSIGSKTRFTGTRVTGPDDGIDDKKAGFSICADSQNFKYTWTGSGCGTRVGFVSVKKVETSTSGEYPNNVHITETDNEVFWKEDKDIEITVDPGYSLSRVTVDGVSINIDTLTYTNGKYHYIFEDVIEDHKIDVQVQKNPHHLYVHHYIQNTTTKIGNEDRDDILYYGDSYTTSRLSNIPTGYEFVGPRDDSADVSGTMPDSDVIVNYEYKLKNYTLTVHHYILGTSTMVPNVTEDETRTLQHGEHYTTNVSSNVSSNYEFDSKTDNFEGTITKNEEVTYYYKKKIGRLIVHHYIDGTTTELAPTEQYTREYGTTYETAASTNIPQNYILKETPSNYRGEIDKPETVVTYYYQKKDSNIVPTIDKTGTDRITSSNQKVSYRIVYTANFTDLIGNGTVTIVDTLPYKIDPNNSNLNGGTYNDNNKTITWTENIDINSYNEPSKTFEKNIELAFLNVNPAGDVLVNSVKGTINADGKNIEVTDTFNTLIDVNGTITVRYIDRETNQPIVPNIETTDKVGISFTPTEKEFEGYTLVSKPEDKNYKYEETPQTLTYFYEKIRLKVITRVNGTGGTIEGDEIVLYGNDSTKDKIKMQADNGYIISKVTINGDEVEISNESTSMVLSNFLRMNQDKLIEVSFDKKPLVVEVEKTGSNTPLILIGTLFIGLTVFFGYYLYKKDNMISLFSKYRKNN